MESATQTTHSQPYLTVQRFSRRESGKASAPSCRHGSSTKLYQGTARELGNLVLPKNGRIPPKLSSTKMDFKTKRLKNCNFLILNHFVTDQPFFPSFSKCFHICYLFFGWNCVRPAPIAQQIALDLAKVRIFKKNRRRIGGVLFGIQPLSRWWFQIFCIFIPTWGNDPI